MVFNNDTGYIPQLKQQKTQKGDISFAVHHHNNVLFVFAVSGAVCSKCHP